MATAIPLMMPETGACSPCPAARKGNAIGGVFRAVFAVFQPAAPCRCCRTPQKNPIIRMIALQNRKRRLAPVRHLTSESKCK
ncbi:hypothetical protein [Kamptonema formosum]|uniref:hypothetical protein n=1 Tax=Kamptonema formosum TaxID=331992 RepID=UPI0012DE35B4|nr:hypothetical protein [Oscillatoria sp. PCC 10802]